MGDPRTLARTLQYYKRPEVQEAIFRHAEDREVSPRYGEGFGKRPDMLAYPKDVLEFAVKKTTSFHCSEERWENPLQIVTGASRKDMDDLRIGWDLVLDIDAKNWEISRLTAWLFIRALSDHGIESISIKFSGNKGWHVGVPWEAFPESIVNEKGEDVLTKNLFPELPRAIASYLVEYITEQLITLDKDEILFAGKIKTSLTSLAKKAGKTKKDLIGSYNLSSGKFVTDESLYALWCQSCGNRKQDRMTKEEVEALSDKERLCPKCKHWMDPYPLSRKPVGEQRLQPRIQLNQIIEFDTILLASRHLYRMPYSLHEKSGLVSVVIDPDHVLQFKKTEAEPDQVTFERTFLDGSRASRDEGERLVKIAMEKAATFERKVEQRTEFEVPDEAIPEELFPPCIKNILSGLQDGKKRAMFALTNFLKVCGWSPEMIDERLTKWNESNPEKLREVTLKGHLRGKARSKERIPPPNCKSFYQELGVCQPDQTCALIKNPAQYSVKLVKIGKK